VFHRDFFGPHPLPPLPGERGFGPQNLFRCAAFPSLQTWEYYVLTRSD
jgi:hypothetical protein